MSYSILDGPRGSYRYLLSARDGRMLERELLAGASRRLNRRITSLSALGDTYYRVGPVEQYLMLAGRVFFRGLAYHDLHRLQFDLETTSLDPARGLCWLLSLSVPKKSGNDGSTSSFSFQSTHQRGGLSFPA